MSEKERVRRIIIDKETGEKYFRVNGELVKFEQKKYGKLFNKKLKKKELGVDVKKLAELQKLIIAKLKKEIIKLRAQTRFRQGRVGRMGRQTSYRDSQKNSKVKEQIDALKKEVKKLSDLITNERSRLGKERDDEHKKKEEEKKEEKKQQEKIQAQQLAIQAQPQPQLLIQNPDPHGLHKYVIDKMFEKAEPERLKDHDNIFGIHEHNINLGHDEILRVGNRVKGLEQRLDNQREEVKKELREEQAHRIDTNLKNFKESMKLKSASQKSASQKSVTPRDASMAESSPLIVLNSPLRFSAPISKKPSRQSQHGEFVENVDRGLKLIKEKTDDIKLDEDEGEEEKGVEPPMQELNLTRENQSEPEQIVDMSQHQAETSDRQRISLDPESPKEIRTVPHLGQVEPEIMATKKPRPIKKKVPQSDVKSSEIKEKTGDEMIDDLKNIKKPTLIAQLSHCVRAVIADGPKSSYPRLVNSRGIDITEEVLSAASSKMKTIFSQRDSEQKRKVLSVADRLVSYNPELANDFSGLIKILFLPAQVENIWPKFLNEGQSGKGAGDDNKGTTNIDLDNLMYPFKKIINYKGCVPLDYVEEDILQELSNSDVKNEFCFIFNTLISEDLKTTVGHWCCVFYSESEGECCIYDPLGEHTTKSKMYKIMKGFIDEHEPETFLKLKFNGKVEPNASTMCGLYCIRYLYFRAMGASHKEASNFHHDATDEETFEKIKDEFIYV